MNTKASQNPSKEDEKDTKTIGYDVHNDGTAKNDRGDLKRITALNIVSNPKSFSYTYNHIFLGTPRFLAKVGGVLPKSSWNRTF